MRPSALVRRTTMPRPSAPMDRRAPIAKESTKRKKDRAAYRRMKAAVYERDGHTCQAAALVPDVACGGPLDPQHVIPRSAWAGGRLVAENVLCVCRRHHDWIGSHKQAAADLGLHGWSWSPRPTEGTHDA